MKRLSVLVGALVALAACAEIEWKWDTSGRAEIEPEVASADIASALPVAAAAVSAEGTLNLFGFSFLESNLFRLSGSPTGLLIIAK